jgi:hypothetical protein
MIVCDQPIQFLTRKPTTMKRIWICSLAAGLLFSACKGKGTTFTSEDGDTKVTVDVSGMQDAAEEMNAKMEELKKLTPLTTEQIKAMLPEELLGMKRSSFNATTAMGFATGDAEYTKDDTVSIRLTIWDCAGEAGSSFYALNYWTKMSMESQNDDGYTKTVDFMGGKAVEDYKIYNEAYSLTYTSNERLMVTIAGNHVSLSDLQGAAKALNLKVSG